VYECKFYLGAKTVKVVYLKYVESVCYFYGYKNYICCTSSLRDAIRFILCL